MPRTRRANRYLRKTRRKRLGKTAFIDTLNNDFQEMMRNRKEPRKHLFFQSINWWKTAYNGYRNDHYTLKNKDHVIDYNPTADISLLNPLPDCKFIPKKTLTPTYLKKFYEQLRTTTDYSKIQDKCHDMTNYALPSPTDNPLKTWKQFDDPTAINIMILGSGPVGLYTALYLQNYYYYDNLNDDYNMKNFSLRKVNILLVENRILKEGVKMPYSRSTQFGFSIQEIQPFLKQIFCWKNTDMATVVRAFDFIHVLENILYTVAYNKEIPMAFTKQFEDYEALKTFVDKENVHVLFDCTGGRSGIPTSYPVRWNQYSFKEGNQEIRQNPTTKYYEFLEDGKLFTKQIFRPQLLGKRNQEILVGNMFAYPTDPEDIELAKKYNNTCFKVKDYLVFISKFKDEKTRNLFPYLLDDPDLKKKHIESVKLVVYDTIARHSPFAAAPFHKGCTLVRVGDSLGGTEWGIVFGMKDSIQFSKHICNLLSTFF